MGKACDENTIAVIRKRYAEGATAVQLAMEYFVSEYTIQNYCKGVKPSYNNKKLSPEVVQKIIELRKTLPVNEIAKRLGVCKYSVAKYSKQSIPYPRKLTNNKINEIMQARKTMSVKAASKKCGVSCKTICKYQYGGI